LKARITVPNDAQLISSASDTSFAFRSSQHSAQTINRAIIFAPENVPPRLLQVNLSYAIIIDLKFFAGIYLVQK
jgi:hypothetical protein